MADQYFLFLGEIRPVLWYFHQYPEPLDQQQLADRCGGLYNALLDAGQIDTARQHKVFVLCVSARGDAELTVAVDHESFQPLALTQNDIREVWRRLVDAPSTEKQHEVVVLKTTGAAEQYAIRCLPGPLPQIPVRGAQLDWRLFLPVTSKKPLPP